MTSLHFHRKSRTKPASGLRHDAPNAAPSAIAAAINATPPAAWLAATATAKEMNKVHEVSAAPEAPETSMKPGDALRHGQSAIVRTIGARLKAARELCNLSLSEAASRLGYSNPSKLSKVENATDTNSVPLRLIHDAAHFYEVSTDYLFGLSEDWDVGSWRGATPWLLAKWDELRARDMAALVQLHQHARTATAVIPALQRDAQAVLDALRRVEELNDRFEDLRGGARLLAAAEHLTETAGDAAAAERRLRLEFAAPTSTAGEPEQCGGPCR